MIDYEILKAIWWLFIGVLLVGFTIMDGQDMGVGTLLPFLGKNDSERRIMINSVAPHWDGNQVWFVTGGGAMFAAWPLMYAIAFSGFYWAMLVILAALMFRPLAFDYRSKVPAERWRSSWDWLLFVGSAVPPIICGVAFGNLLQGVPFEIDSTMRPVYTGSFFGLLNPFGLFCGIVSIVMVIFHGANYLALRTEGSLHQRAVSIASISGVLTAVLFALGGVWTYLGIDGYVAVAGLDPAGPANPLAKTVELQASAWFSNFAAYPRTLACSCLRDLRRSRWCFDDSCWPRLACDYLLIHFASRNRTDAACFDVPICDAVFNDAQCRFDALGLHQLPAHA